MPDNYNCIIIINKLFDGAMLMYSLSNHNRRQIKKIREWMMAQEEEKTKFDSAPATTSTNHLHTRCLFEELWSMEMSRQRILLDCHKHRNKQNNNFRGKQRNMKSGNNKIRQTTSLTTKVYQGALKIVRHPRVSSRFLDFITYFSPTISISSIVIEKNEINLRNKEWYL